MRETWNFCGGSFSQWNHHAQDKRAFKHWQCVSISWRLKSKKKPSYFLRPPRVVIGIASQFPLEVDRVQFCLAIDIRPRAILGGFSALWFLKYLDQFLSALAILGHSERFSPGNLRSEVGRPRVSHSPSGRPTSDRKLLSENLSEWPEIARALRNCPKYFKNS